MKRLLVGTVIAVGAVAGCNAGSPEPSGPVEPVALPLSAVEQIEALLAEKEARTPAQRKISSQLLYLRSGAFAAKAARGTEQLKSLFQLDDAGRVLVDVKGSLGTDLKARVETAGGRVVDSSPPHGSARAWLPLDRIETLAADPAVRAIRPALQAQTWRADPPRGDAKSRGGSRAERVEAVRQATLRALGARRVSGLSTPTTPPNGPVANVGVANSQGSKAHGADRARKFFNVDGTGVRIGVLSDSDDFKEQSIATGDLPADTFTLPGQDGRPGTGEGTAMMEIVHDVAPGAKLFFASAFNSPESFAENIRALRFTHHCDIIVDDVIYFFESPYADDIIAQAVEDVTKNGAMYFSSAGNGGNFSDGTSGTWEGDFKSAGTLSSLPSAYFVHDFGSRVISNRVETAGGPLVLHWSDPGTMDDPQSSNDYDLFILDPDLRNVVVAATDIQDGTGFPAEFLGFFIPPNFRIVIAKHPGAKTRAVHLALFGGELGLGTPGSTFGHNSAPGAIGVAAVDSFEAGGGEFFAGPTTPIELFSSDGPRRVFYNRHNNPIQGGVTFASGGGELRKQPELTGADGVATTLPPFSGLNPFFGTSAAAPHAAAIAGLIKSAAPKTKNAKIRQALIDGALDIEARGFDHDSGAGIVSAMNSLREVGAKPSVFLDLGTVTATPSSGEVVVPGGAASLLVQLTNNGGAGATAVKATLSSSTPGVTITQAMSNYPNLAPGASANNLTAFAVAVGSSVTCGTRLVFTLTVTFNGAGSSPRLFTFSVQTGSPGGTATNFAYAGPPIEIPDADVVGVDVPFTVSSLGSLSKLVLRIEGDVCSAENGATGVGLDHTFVGDLVFRLTSPSGTSVTLINHAGADGNNFCQTILDDLALQPIQDIFSFLSPFTGVFRPANPLDAFAGENPEGTWILNVSDQAFLDVGSVRAVSLDVTGYSCSGAAEQLNETFDTGIGPWNFSDFTGGALTNIAVDIPPGGSPPTLTFDGTAGDPSPGSLAVTVGFTAVDQYVDAGIPFDGVGRNMIGKALHVRIRLASGTFTTGGVQVYLNSGPPAFGFLGFFLNSSEFPLGQWVPITLDVSSLMQGFDPTRVIRVGAQFFSGFSANGDMVQPSGDTVFEIDTVTE